MTASDGVFRAPNAIGGEDPTPGPSKGGRPPHAASYENRRQVKVMAARLMPQEAIAAIIGISDDTLRKYYGEELRQGDAEGCLKVSRALDKLLEGGSEKAILHLAKVKLGLTETRRHEHKVSGKDGEPFTIEDYMRMPMEDLRKRIEEIDAILAEE